MSGVGPGYSLPDAKKDMYPTCAVAVTLASDFNVATAFNMGYARELYVGGTGTVIAQMIDDTGPITYTGVPAGTILKGYWTLVKSSGNGTTATGIVARA